MPASNHIARFFYLACVTVRRHECAPINHAFVWLHEAVSQKLSSRDRSTSDAARCAVLSDCSNERSMPLFYKTPSFLCFIFLCYIVHDVCHLRHDAHRLVSRSFVSRHIENSCKEQQDNCSGRGSLMYWAYPGLQWQCKE